MNVPDISSPRTVPSTSTLKVAAGCSGGMSGVPTQTVAVSFRPFAFHAPRPVMKIEDERPLDPVRFVEPRHHPAARGAISVAQLTKALIGIT